MPERREGEQRDGTQCEDGGDGVADVGVAGPDRALGGHNAFLTADTPQIEVPIASNEPSLPESPNARAAARMMVPAISMSIRI